MLPGGDHGEAVEPSRRPLLQETIDDGQLSASVPRLYRSTLEGWGELIKCVCCPFICFQMGPIAVVEQGWVAVLTRFGVFERVLQPGMYVYNCMSQVLHKVCMKMQTIEIPRQEAMTRDNLSLRVDAVTFVTVVDPARATFEVTDYHHAVKTLAASTLLRVIGEHDLQQIFRDRSTINERLTQTMQGKTVGWGLQVAGVEMRDINIPDSMQRAMAQIAEANREAEAKVIVAEGQRKASFIFADAAEAMEKQPMSLQLQWFETLRQIAGDKNSTVIVPDSVIGSLSDLARSARGGGQSGLPFHAPAAARGAEEDSARTPPEHAWLQVGAREK